MTSGSCGVVARCGRALGAAIGFDDDDDSSRLVRRRSRRTCAGGTGRSGRSTSPSPTPSRRRPPPRPRSSPPSSGSSSSSRSAPPSPAPRRPRRARSRRPASPKAPPSPPTPPRSSIRLPGRDTRRVRTPVPRCACRRGFTAATEPRKSKLWIVWVVLGVVLLGIVIAAAVVIPLLFLSASRRADRRCPVRRRARGGRHGRALRRRLAGRGLRGAHRRDDRGLPHENGFTDCATFEEQAVAFNEALDEYDVAVTDVETLRR